MPTQQTLLAFALVSAAIMVIPGPSNLFLLAHGMAVEAAEPGGILVGRER